LIFFWIKTFSAPNVSKHASFARHMTNKVS